MVKGYFNKYYLIVFCVQGQVAVADAWKTVSTFIPGSLLHNVSFTHNELTDGRMTAESEHSFHTYSHAFYNSSSQSDERIKSFTRDRMQLQETHLANNIFSFEKYAPPFPKPKPQNICYNNVCISGTILRSFDDSEQIPPYPVKVTMTQLKSPADKLLKFDLFDDVSQKKCKSSLHAHFNTLQSLFVSSSAFRIDSWKFSLIMSGNNHSKKEILTNNSLPKYRSLKNMRLPWACSAQIMDMCRPFQY